MKKIYERGGCAVRTAIARKKNTIACGVFCGENWKIWLAIVTKPLWKKRLCIKEYHCIWSFLREKIEKKMTCNRDKTSMKEKVVYQRIALRVEFFGGKLKKWLAIVTKPLWKKRLCVKEYHCMWSFLVGNWKKWLAIVTKPLWKKRLCIKEYHCMRLFWGKKGKNDLQSWPNPYEKGGCVQWGLGEVEEMTCNREKNLWKRRLCSEDCDCT